MRTTTRGCLFGTAQLPAAAIDGAPGPFAFQQADIVGIHGAAIHREPVRHAAKPQRFRYQVGMDRYVALLAKRFEIKARRFLRRARSWIAVGPAGTLCNAQRTHTPMQREVEHTAIILFPRRHQAPILARSRAHRLAPIECEGSSSSCQWLGHA